jgi:hypothetical protein
MSENEYLQIGLGGPWAFVEHVVDTPWKAEVALARSRTLHRPEFVSFICGGQDSEIPGQYLMPTAEAIDIVVSCLHVRGASPECQWELV